MSYDFLYPVKDDEEFNVRIAKRKEFNDTRAVVSNQDVEKAAKIACEAEFELAPHQVFARNYLSSQTPYNGLLLYHDLGTGKTCTAIGVAEETRAYMKQMGTRGRILVVASPNVQDNFRLQLFDERKLTSVDGLWDIKSCNGSRMIKEVNPMNIRGISRERVVRLVKRLVNDHYMFMGYLEFANYILRVAGEGRAAEAQKARLRRHFRGRLLVIDEIHNVRMAGDVATKRVAQGLQYLVDNVQGLKLLFLSATPMYNSPTEIVWLLNLFNKNDGRPTLRVADVFDANGELKARTEEDGESGAERLVRAATGYVSYVRGQSPYAFPFRVWPSLFDPSRSYESSPVPSVQITGRQLSSPLQYLSTYMVNIKEPQASVYNEIVRRLRDGTLVAGQQAYGDVESMDGLGYTLLQRPLEALNIAFPVPDLKTAEARDLVGKGGLDRLVSHELTGTPPKRTDYRYVDGLQPRIFDPGLLDEYSCKMAAICDRVSRAQGICLIYSQYIDGGIVPCALALEQMGFRRHGGGSLWASGELPDVANAGSYVIISGDKTLSPNNNADVRAVTDRGNADGSAIKVVLISQAGSEGLDFKCVRQVHVLEPWYNLNRIEQIIGRAVRNLSHCELPFDQRNVEIYLYGTVLRDTVREAADMYVYRLAEAKAIQIGKIQRLLKASSVDCILNRAQQSFSADLFGQTASQTLASGKEIEMVLGSQPYSAACDFMKECFYSCIPDASVMPAEVSMDTFSDSFIEMNNDKIIQRIKVLYRSRHFYEKAELYASIRAIRDYPTIQIDAALQQLTTDKNEFITDAYGRLGRLINVGELYMFSPLEVTAPESDLRSLRVPLDVKPVSVSVAQAPEPTVAEDSEPEEAQAVTEFFSSADIACTPPSDVVKKDSWVEMAYGAREHLVGLHGITDDKCDLWACWHLFEQLSVDTQLSIMNLATDQAQADVGPRRRTMDRVLQYIDAHKLVDGDTIGLMLASLREPILVVKTRGVWAVATPEDYIDLGDAIAGRAATYQPVNEKLAPFVGFMSPFKRERMVFKVKDLGRIRNRGARCDQASKKSALALANSLAGSEILTASRALPQTTICIVQEYLLRAYQEQQKDNRRWFASVGFASFMNIETLGK